MQQKTSKRLLDRSLEWVRQHMNATNLDVPQDLLKLWIYNQDSDESDLPPGLCLSVFVYGYMIHDFEANPAPDGTKREIPMERVMEMFRLWQLRLALNELYRCTEVRSKPLPLFSFSDHEQLAFWLDREGLRGANPEQEKAPTHDQGSSVPVAPVAPPPGAAGR